ncbi:glycosyltransferase [Aurantiacibacter xanthus]|uniref:Glycosyltransferase n=1 Tax=Aurantiacibacter xanthus TaxID=1784712 RepID=A0A3A1P577_9SPHN|nr:glycosyltransferase [Aurantiacibacter xanthus]RIV87308.1 glycosyltransferase [Aurantiacibacter xanthus]
MAEPVTICICTYRRPSLFETLASIAQIRLAEVEVAAVLVVDNDVTDALRSEVTDFAGSYRFPLRYCHAPAQNISIARNAALDGVETRWAAFIDDDEVASTDWLEELYAGAEGAEAVIGQSVAQYGPALPGWAARCDFHSNRITGRVDNAYTSNALLDVDFLRRNAIRFREELGRTGGEDTLLFRQLTASGGRIVYRPESVVYEDVPSSRASMTWVFRRMFRAGQTHGLLSREFDARGFSRLGLTAGAKALVSAAMTVATLPGSDASRRWAARAALHCGALSYRVRPTILEEYGAAPSPTPSS